MRSYASFVYLFIFLPGAFLAYTITPKKLKPWMLLLVSLAYYYVNAKKTILLLLLGVIAVTYVTALILGVIQSGYDNRRKDLDKDQRKILKESITRKKKAVLAIAILLLIGNLVLFKYSQMIVETMNYFIKATDHTAKLSFIKLTIPMGISFYTLQAIGYMVDVYRGKYPPEKNIGKIALFLSFFPQLMEGPIGRYDLMSETLNEGHSFSYERLAFASQRILWGLFKVLVISGRAGRWVSTTFNKEESIGIGVVIGILMYTLQIYANFSGSIDMVIGTAELFGVRLSENFNQPFRSKTITEFWQRWHMTLSSWLRDYVFYSLSMSRAFKSISKSAKAHLSRFLGSLLPATFALFFVWLANGFWHGASWKYVCYGLYYFVLIFLGMLFEPLFQKMSASTGISRKSKGFQVWQTVRTFILVNIGMFLFRADTLKQFGQLTLKIFQGNWFSQLGSGVLLKSGLDIYDWAVLIVAFVLVCLVGHLKEKGNDVRSDVAAMSLPVRWLIYIGLFALVLICGAYGEGYGLGGFIYAEF